MANNGTQPLEELIKRLHDIFANDKVDIDEVKHVMERYKSNPKDWEQFAFYDQHKYTRNLVDKGNGKFNLIVLCWSEGQGSGIHDHSDSHCFMKILDGQLKETLYDWPSESNTEQPLKVVGMNYFNTNSVAYINDSVGLHRVENESHSNTAISLHLYSPPFDFCQSFDQRTSHCRKHPITFFSEMGKKTTIWGKWLDRLLWEFCEKSGWWAWIWPLY